MSVNGLQQAALVIAFADLAVGRTARLSWDVEAAEIDQFAVVSGDRNPLHMDPAFARSKGFSDRVAHGFLLGAKVSALVGMLLPGRDCLILEQSLAYPRPVYPDDIILIEGEITDLSPEQQVLKVRVRAYRVEGEHRSLVARGHVLCQNR